MKMQKGPTINEKLCTGCGACVDVCCQKIYRVIKGLAAVIKPEACCGSGECCVPACPVGAISFSEKKAPVSKCSCGCSSTGCC